MQYRQINSGANANDTQQEISYNKLDVNLLLQF